MCLVEVKPGPPKPQASCALPAMDGQKVFTETPTVHKAREGIVLDFSSIVTFSVNFTNILYLLI